MEEGGRSRVGNRSMPWERQENDGDDAKISRDNYNIEQTLEKATLTSPCVSFWHITDWKISLK